MMVNGYGGDLVQCAGLPSFDRRMVMTGLSPLPFFQINADGVTRNFYPGDTHPLWHDELEAQNSLLDVLASGGAGLPEPMST